MAVKETRHGAGNGKADSFIRQREAAGLVLTEECCKGEVQKALHSHARAYIEIILKGAYLEREKDRCLEYRGLSVVYQPPVESHATQILPEGVHCLKVDLGHAWLNHTCGSMPSSCLRRLDRPASYTDGTLTWLGVRLYAEYQKQDSASSLAIQGILLEMIAETIRYRTADRERTPPWLKELRDFLHVQFAEPLTLESIAQTVGLHPVYVARAFRKQHGCSIADYVRRLRVEYAGKQLVTTDIPLTEIARTAGFMDQSHFSRVFKHFVGISPAAYRTALSPRRLAKR